MSKARRTTTRRVPNAQRAARHAEAPHRDARPPRLERVDEVCWRLPREQREDMRVDGLVFATDALMVELRDDPSLGQLANVATLPGIVGQALAMLGEEAFIAYKDVSAVVRVAEVAGHLRSVARLRPLIVVKG